VATVVPQRSLLPVVSGATVLVVDDNATNVALARATLEDDGYRVLVASDAETGITAFQRLRPQCVLLDVRMPGLDGVGACRRIRALPGGAEVAIVFVTAAHDVETFDRALAAGGDDFVTKPYRPSELAMRIQTALRLRRVAQERDELYALLKHQRDELQRAQLTSRDAMDQLVLARTEAAAKQARIDEARERFIGVLGHDLRNPLAAILMGVELLDELPAAKAVIVERIGRSAHRMEAMIRDMLDFARGRLGGGIPIAPMWCDLGGLCDGVVDEIRQAHPTRPLSLEVTGDLRGHWDPDRLEQGISNLVGNAVTHGTGPIRVTCRAEDEAVVTTVENAGPPIPAAMLPTLFEPFTGTHRLDGLGLGLYIAHEIVQAHGGTIAAASEAVAGTTCTIRLPRQRDAVSAA